MGPGRLPRALRRHTVSGARALASTTGSIATGERPRQQAARHLDALRIAGLVAAALVALLFASWTAFLVILLVLSAYELGVTLFARLAGTG
ncbi:hypothetical protein [Spirillospora sp. CA-128828]|uniref:hypothetical protein n=1 Tax=Spirillospora sp. CA-128828 TaxID=3240033 RepID=UPI003D92E35F